ncbi:MAG: hypothetical protein EAZ08_12925 [Cytophagales bacterium]|nr:MAG: hypothetical protein EAZ08_12925 [Cytophagales bacterium]
MRKPSKKFGSRNVVLYVIENNLSRLFPKANNAKTKYSFEDLHYLLLIEHYLSDLQRDNYSSYIFVHDENKDFLNVNFKENPTFSERVYTNYLAEALEGLENSITESKEYHIFIQKDIHFPEGEKCVIGDNGQLIILSTFKYKEWVDEDSKDFQLFLGKLIDEAMSTKSSRTGSSLREILDLDSDDEI